MMVIDQLNKLEEIGMLKELTHPEVGLIDEKYIRYREYYLKFKLFRSTGVKKMLAYSLISEQCGVHEDTVRLACRIMTRRIRKLQARKLSF